MDISAIVAKEANALWQVLVVGLLLGAGLPTLFALGIKSLNSGRVVRTGQFDGEDTLPSVAGTVGATACFAVCVLAVLFGIVVIIWGKRLFGA